MKAIHKHDIIFKLKKTDGQPYIDKNTGNAYIFGSEYRDSSLIALKLIFSPLL